MNPSEYLLDSKLSANEVLAIKVVEYLLRCCFRNDSYPIWTRITPEMVEHIESIVGVDLKSEYGYEEYLRNKDAYEQSPDQYDTALDNLQKRLNFFRDEIKATSNYYQPFDHYPDTNNYRTFIYLLDNGEVFQTKIAEKDFSKSSSPLESASTQDFKSMREQRYFEYALTKKRLEFMHSKMSMASLELHELKLFVDKVKNPWNCPNYSNDFSGCTYLVNISLFARKIFNALVLKEDCEQFCTSLLSPEPIESRC
jgi:hypothetical protein